MKNMLWVIGLLCTAATVRAQQEHYVIKVTPTLVYVDLGQSEGVQVGDTYLILSEQGPHWAQIAEMSVVRVADGFSIGEITYVEAGNTIEVLQRVISTREWQMMADQAQQETPVVHRAQSAGPPKRSILIMYGGEWGRTTQLQWNAENDLLRGADANNGSALSLRLGQVLKTRWRLNFTYRTSLGDDVKDLAIEADVHRLLSDYHRAGFYVGAGVGLHQLSVDAPGKSDDSANKVGFNFTAGLQVPGRWTLILETGYQQVAKWGPAIDVSNMRTYVGLGRTF